jgi:cyclophilin family peptidyl-prolyl cis-trans isomerase
MFRPAAAITLALAAGSIPACAVSQTSSAAAQPSPTEIIDAAKPAEWVTIAPADLLVMELSRGAGGRQRRVVIQLMQPPFSAGWVSNIRKLAAAHWWDGTSINRVQDNYVAQWGDASEKKALPAGLAVVSESGYLTDWHSVETVHTAGGALVKSGVQRERIAASLDSYAGKTGWADGWPLGFDEAHAKQWPLHCYAMVGVGRDLSPNTGSGAELYAVIGQAPRQLDRNIALVGRVIEGIEHLSALPRGTGKMGFYETAAERVPIMSVRLGSELPEGAVGFQYLSTQSDSFSRYADARANRRDPFFIQPAGGADICNIPVPVRRVKVGG